MKSTPLPPVLTTFAPGSPSALAGLGGALGLAGTTILSPDHLGYDPFVGGRFILGGWLDNDQQFGLEVSGFFLANRTAGVSNFSDANGAPSLRVPFFNVPPGAGFPLGQSSFGLAEPGFAAGGQILSSSLQMWGAEGNALFHAINGQDFSLSLLGGIRYLEMKENLSLISSETIFALASKFTGTDTFGTRNQFYGANLGVTAQAQFGQFYGSLVAKVALGDDHESVTVHGVNSLTVPPTMASGGIFAQSTNIGRRSRDEFCVVPEVQLKVGVNLSSRISAFAGYDFLYMSNVIRPGDQIDRTLNFTSNATLNGGAAGLVGAARPEPQFNGSGFWAQGISLGFQIEF